MTTSRTPRLAVVAAIIDDGASDASATSGSRVGSRYREAAADGMAASPTPEERALARALRGEGADCKYPVGDPVMAELLLLANDCPEAGELALGLSQAFLPPDNSLAAVAPRDRRPAFAALYRRLALHQLDSQVRNRAAAVLRKLNARTRRPRI
jgi:hypothetical protein